MSETVAAVVVTYNRKSLLAECLEGVLSQQRSVNKIYLIDNASTDGTKDLLSERGYLNNPLIVYIRLNKNVGGAGGFSKGIEYAIAQNATWVWLMDDDTIPSRTALGAMLNSIKKINSTIDFACSRVNWTDGMPHLMNAPFIQPSVNKLAFNVFEDANCYIIEACSFVSVLIRSKAIEKAGLPIKEMFIWADDMEYTLRLTGFGFTGVYCKESVVVHATDSNYCADIFTDSINNAWKHRYGIRNNLHIIKSQKGLVYFIVKVAHNLTALNIKILMARKSKSLPWLYANTRGSLGSLFFQPKIDYIKVGKQVVDKHEAGGRR
jgi:GT2 family glycosyltransferase